MNRWLLVCSFRQSSIQGVTL